MDATGRLTYRLLNRDTQAKTGGDQPRDQPRLVVF